MDEIGEDIGLRVGQWLQEAEGVTMGVAPAGHQGGHQGAVRRGVTV